MAASATGILNDRVAIVTGAGSGIGQAGAIALAREGAHVVVLDMSPEGCAQTLEFIKTVGGKAEAHVLDPHVARRPAAPGHALVPPSRHPLLGKAAGEHAQAASLDARRHAGRLPAGVRAVAAACAAAPSR